MNVLIIDDEDDLRGQLIKYLSLESITASGAINGKEGIELLSKHSFDAVVVDLKMPVMDGLEFIKKARSLGFRMPIIMMSAHGETMDAVEALKSGANDYIIKPFLPDELVFRLNSVSSAFKSKNKEEVKNAKSEISFVGESSEITRIKGMVQKMSFSTSNVLLTGESGTGKEVLGRFIHNTSPLAQGPFVAINIGGIPENLIESELFGYEKGAFTGAVNRKPGLFELASGGTLFLDEIGEASPSLQVKLLRVIQDKTIMRVGGMTNIPINVRFISATNRNLEECIKNGTFREDLYFRINVVHIALPPLRERKGDIMILANNILKKLSISTGSIVNGFTKEAEKKLVAYSFPGNIRELENMIERALIFTSGDKIEAESLALSYSNESLDTADTDKKSSNNDSSVSLKDAEKEAIKKALIEANNNRTKASALLGISRRSLIQKIEEYNL